MTRATIIWFVGAAVVGAGAGGLHLLRSEIGGAHTGLPLAVSAFALTTLSAAMLFHGVMVAAHEQDDAAGPGPDLFDDDDEFEVDDQADEAEGVDEAGEVELQESETVHQADDVEDADDVQGPAHDEGPAVYTFRGGKPVKDRSRRTGRRDGFPR